MLPAISENRGCCDHQARAAHLTPPSSIPTPWGALMEVRMETGYPPPSSQPLQRCPTVHPEGTQDEKEPDTGPRQLRYISKE